jgi:hypothetical protein
MAIGKKTGGRAAGSKNKATLAKEAQTQVFVAAATSEGLMPLEYLLRVLRDEGQDKTERFKAAIEAAPYLHAKLQAVKVSGDDENPVKTILEVVWGSSSSSVSKS